MHLYVYICVYSVYKWSLLLFKLTCHEHYDITQIWYNTLKQNFYESSNMYTKGGVGVGAKLDFNNAHKLWGLI